MFVYFHPKSKFDVVYIFQLRVKVTFITYSQAEI